MSSIRHLKSYSSLHLLVYGSDWQHLRKLLEQPNPKYFSLNKEDVIKFHRWKTLCEDFLFNAIEKIDLEMSKGIVEICSQINKQRLLTKLNSSNFYTYHLWKYGNLDFMIWYHDFMEDSISSTFSFTQACTFDRKEWAKWIIKRYPDLIIPCKIMKITLNAGVSSDLLSWLAEICKNRNLINDNFDFWKELKDELSSDYNCYQSIVWIKETRLKVRK